MVIHFPFFLKLPETPPSLAGGDSGLVPAEQGTLNVPLRIRLGLPEKPR